jgi:small nuclear ribonucleoprotein (snRNP)-like protein
MTLRGCAVLVLVLLSVSIAGAAEAQTPVPSDTTALRDQVVVYLKEGKIVDGVLIAKGRGIIVLLSADGRLTIPKTNIERIEYVGLPNSEKGERVRVELVNGRTYEGRVQRENATNLSLDTSFGTIDIDKAQLLTLRYVGTPDYRSAGKGPTPPSSPRPHPGNTRSETWSLGYSSGFGTNFHGGYGLTYTRWAPIRSGPAVTVHGAGGMGLTYFGLNNDVKKKEIPGGVDASGRAVLWSLNAAVPLTFHPVDGGLYRFHIVPSISGTLVSRRFEMVYPSFPSNNLKESSTSLRFGVGLDFLFDFALGENNSLGFGFRQRHLSGGESNYSEVVLYWARLRGLFALPWS